MTSETGRTLILLPRFPDKKQMSTTATARSVPSTEVLGQRGKTSSAALAISRSVLARYIMEAEPLSSARALTCKRWGIVHQDIVVIAPLSNSKRYTFYTMYCMDRRDHSFGHMNFITVPSHAMSYNLIRTASRGI